jgi:hypothetical protein
MDNETRILTGLVGEDVFGPWEDVDQGIFINGDKVCASNQYSIFDDYIGRRIRVTIQVLPDEEE